MNITLTDENQNIYTIAELARSFKIRGITREVLDLLIEFTNKKTKKCEMHTKVFADKLNCSVRSVEIALNKLSDLGLVVAHQIKKFFSKKGVLHTKTIELNIATTVAKKNSQKTEKKFDVYNTVDKSTLKSKSESENIAPPKKEVSPKVENKDDQEYTAGLTKKQSRDLFYDTFKTLYPKKTNLKEACRYWQRYKLANHAATIVEMLVYKNENEFKTTEIRYIPNAEKFLKAFDWREDFTVLREAESVHNNNAKRFKHKQQTRVHNPLSQEYYHEQCELNNYCSEPLINSMVGETYDHNNGFGI
ncbi:hypothetical protein [Piscirickettsia litoralis]|uniref:Uncharacterized protein n=1 Tax=Piscirickettsia litoralis TaxID=1891921 RepID=A0ABX2ZWM3_9GAMM|nr:hypothetical protein [Piscirickettsia litoralis]ODN41026.1 hypothetical protein BGC07_18520 [Piscirickettsia litoralis]